MISSSGFKFITSLVALWRNQLGNNWGSYVSYDPSDNTSIWREYMRIRIKVNVRFSLKRKKKIAGKKMHILLSIVSTKSCGNFVSCVDCYLTLRDSA